MFDRPYSQIEHGDNRIQFISFQLNKKKKKLKDQLAEVQDQNLNLQLQIEQLNSNLQQQMVVSKREHMNAQHDNSMVPSSMDDILEILGKRVSTQLSDDGVRNIPRSFF